MEDSLKVLKLKYLQKKERIYYVTKCFGFALFLTDSTRIRTEFFQVIHKSKFLLIFVQPSKQSLDQTAP